MAKRSAPNEQPYRPLLDAGLMSAVLGPPASEEEETPITPPLEVRSGKVLDMPRAEVVKRPEPVWQEPTWPVPEPSAPQIEIERRVPVPQFTVEKIDQEKRILFTRAETQAIDRLVTSLAMRLDCQVKVSHVIRALVTLLLHADGAIDRRAGEEGPLVRPANGDAQALQKFEREIAKIISAAFRDAGPLR